MASSTSVPFPLATASPYTGPGSAAGDSGQVDSAAGAAGTDSGAVDISHGALIAIIVVVCAVGVMGILASVLFYTAKKREWKISEAIRRSARRVVTALTPRRSEFPRSAKEPRSSRSARSRSHTMLSDEVPPTPRLPQDLEKGPSAGS